MISQLRIRTADRRGNVKADRENRQSRRFPESRHRELQPKNEDHKIKTGEYRQVECESEKYRVRPPQQEKGTAKNPQILNPQTLWMKKSFLCTVDPQEKLLKFQSVKKFCTESTGPTTTTTIK